MQHSYGRAARRSTRASSSAPRWRRATPRSATRCWPKTSSRLRATPIQRALRLAADAPDADKCAAKLDFTEAELALSDGVVDLDRLRVARAPRPEAGAGSRDQDRLSAPRPCASGVKSASRRAAIALLVGFMDADAACRRELAERTPAPQPDRARQKARELC